MKRHISSAIAAGLALCAPSIALACPGGSCGSCSPLGSYGSALGLGLGIGLASVAIEELFGQRRRRGA